MTFSNDHDMEQIIIAKKEKQKIFFYWKIYVFTFLIEHNFCMLIEKEQF